MIRIWLAAVVRRHRWRLLATTLGVTSAVALVAALGSFLSAAEATMTTRAASQVAVDWQVQLQPGADLAEVLAATAAEPQVRQALPVDFATLPGLTATVDGGTQTTGAAVILGLPDGYAQAFPGQTRTLAGADHGVLLAQQTAANLHAEPGTVITLERPGLPAVAVRVDGVVDLPQANSLFQKVGAPPQAQPVAPPDNVALLPEPRFQQLLAPLAKTRPDLIGSQIHVARSHTLPAAPAAAFTQVTAAARHLEAALAGTGLVGDNLGAALDAARSDALYARLLFLFLGLPAAVLAGLLTAAVTAAGAPRRRREQATLRTRGASMRMLSRLAGAEAALIGTVGAGAGLAAAALIGRTAFGSAAFGASGADAAVWLVAAAGAGLLIAVVTTLLPARRDARTTTVHSARTPVSRARDPRWLRYGIDIQLLLASALVFRWTSGANYALILAPEGVATISVNYWALLGPTLFWLGSGLLTWRLTTLLLGRGRPLMAVALRPMTGQLSTTAAASLTRQRRLVARSVALVALAVSFAVSTATFNATYRQQADVDARLTNGADVTVTEPPGSTATASAASDLSAVPGVRQVEPVLHRFAYVGADLQDLYGVRPQTIAAATSLQDAYFAGGTAATLIGRLAQQKDAVLVSAETVKDYQLRPGDTLRLRLPTANGTPTTAGGGARARTVAFRYVGVVKEFPTAPKDSFFVANADYVAQATGSAAVGAFLIDTGGRHTGTVAAALRAKLGTAAVVTDLSTVRGTVGSSLTSVDLSGLTRVELAFALALAATAAGLVFGLSLVERRRMFSIAAALGARRRHLAGFVLAEAATVLCTGLLLGAAGGWVLSNMLVKVLTGVFDPPPAQLAVPWAYLACVAATACLAVAAATIVVIRQTVRPSISMLRES
ncbi:FtsX-like permease family protein [Krasilnikovia sp. MM14-A1004]|uniref:FtsX-like permease family protein n=1 Tax=Krasilnikovia sp. MM14-A1004 TaxID=3373541 RepID=UPI00399D1D72